VSKTADATRGAAKKPDSKQPHFLLITASVRLHAAIEVPEFIGEES
jgi:hypothetical protein